MTVQYRTFSRKQVQQADSVTVPVQVGQDGNVAVTFTLEGGDAENGRGIGFSLQVNLADDAGTNLTSRTWAPLRNIGDPFVVLYKGPNETGLMEMHICNGCAYAFNTLPPGAWVRVAIYRLDEMHEDICVGVRTGPGTYAATPGETPAIVQV